MARRIPPDYAVKDRSLGGGYATAVAGTAVANDRAVSNDPAATNEAASNGSGVVRDGIVLYDAVAKRKPASKLRA